MNRMKVGSVDNKKVFED